MTIYSGWIKVEFLSYGKHSQNEKLSKDDIADKIDKSLYLVVKDVKHFKSKEEKNDI